MNYKKWFSKEKNTPTDMNTREKRNSNFLDKKGFYIILFLGIFIVGVSAIWVNKNTKEELRAKENIAKEEKKLEDKISEYNDPVIFLDEDEIVQTEESIKKVSQDKKNVEKKEESKKIVTKPKPKKSKTLVENGKKTEKKSEEVAAASSNKSAIIMRQPAVGKIGMNYTVNTLTYSKTLDQYTTHKGIDILAPINTPVVSALAGEVIEVVTDSRLGITVSIEHENDMITRYSNLSTSKMVSVGDKVEKGQTISGIGKTALFETAEEPHLHFEVLIDGKNVDPNIYLSIK